MTQSAKIRQIWSPCPTSFIIPKEKLQNFYGGMGRYQLLTFEFSLITWSQVWPDYWAKFRCLGALFLKNIAQMLHRLYILATFCQKIPILTRDFFVQKFLFSSALFWAIFGQNWALFFHKTSGHTDVDQTFLDLTFEKKEIKSRGRKALWSIVLPPRVQKWSPYF
jgi:hypothetical protein